ncbi:MAG: DUF1104 domain-containing protein [Wolinella sp.]
MKTTLSIALASLFSLSTLLAADFSKKSDTELKELAGSVAPSDMLDYKSEIHKRMEKMSVEDARKFRNEMHEARDTKFSKMSKEDLEKYRNAVHTEMQKQIDNMSVKEARERGLLRQNDINHEHKHKSERKQDMRNGNKHGHQSECTGK